MEHPFTVVSGSAHPKEAPEDFREFLKDMRHHIKAAAGDPVAFDFRRPDRFARPQVEKLQGLFDSFLRSLDFRLLPYLHAWARPGSARVGQELFSDFVSGLQSPTCLFLLSLEPYSGHGIIELSPALVFPLLEILLGASGAELATIQRSVTEIERNVLKQAVQMMLAELREAWKEFVPFEFHLESVVTDPQALLALPPGEAVAFVSAEVQIRDYQGSMTLAIPCLALERARPRSEQQNAARKAAAGRPASRRVLEVLMRAQVQLEARIQGAHLLVRDLLDLKKDQVIALAHPISRPIDGVVNGQEVLKGDIVAVGSRCGFQISRVEQSAGESAGD